MGCDLGSMGIFGVGGVDEDADGDGVDGSSVVRFTRFV
jgi:hypothetical protein